MDCSNRFSVQEEKLDQIYVTRCKKNLVYHSRWKVPIWQIMALS